MSDDWGSRVVVMGVVMCLESFCDIHCSPPTFLVMPDKVHSVSPFGKSKWYFSL